MDDEASSMSKSAISFMLLLLVPLMPIMVYQMSTVSGREYDPRINIPTVRPTINWPTAVITRSVLTSFSLTSSILSTTIATSYTQPLTSVSPSLSVTTSLSYNTAPSTTSSLTRTTITAITRSPTFTLTSSTGHPTFGGFVLVQYPANYNYNVGSFTLDQTLTDKNGLPCTYYTYFEFNAYAGQQLQAQVWTPGTTVSYIIVPQNLLAVLKQMGCGYGQSGPQSQAHSFNSQIKLNWIAPQTSQYLVIFFSMTPYSGPIYFVPGG